jgi:hypothetical protein
MKGADQPGFSTELMISNKSDQLQHIWPTWKTRTGNAPELKSLKVGYNRVLVII